MIGFAISKMNLLIFVTAIFAIVVYFTFGLSDLMLAQRANYLVETYSYETAAIINSSSNCTEITHTIPSKITYFGGKSLFYVMKISWVTGEESENNQPLYYIVFSIASRKEQDKVIAAKSIATQAEPFLYKQSGEEVGWPLEDVKEGEFLIVDPQSKNRMDSFIVVKATAKGKSYVYIANCSSGGPGGETCSANKKELHHKSEGNCWK